MKLRELLEQSLNKQISNKLRRGYKSNKEIAITSDIKGQTKQFTGTNKDVHIEVRPGETSISGHTHPSGYPLPSIQDYISFIKSAKFNDIDHTIYAKSPKGEDIIVRLTMPKCDINNLKKPEELFYKNRGKAEVYINNRSIERNIRSHEELKNIINQIVFGD